MGQCMRRIFVEEFEEETEENLDSSSEKDIRKNFAKFKAKGVLLLHDGRKNKDTSALKKKNKKNSSQESLLDHDANSPVSENIYKIQKFKKRKKSDNHGTLNDDMGAKLGKGKRSSKQISETKDDKKTSSRSSGKEDALIDKRIKCQKRLDVECSDSSTLNKEIKPDNEKEKINLFRDEPELKEGTSQPIEAWVIEVDRLEAQGKLPELVDEKVNINAHKQSLEKKDIKESILAEQNTPLVGEIAVEAPRENEIKKIEKKDEDPVKEVANAETRYLKDGEETDALLSRVKVADNDLRKTEEIHVQEIKPADENREKNNDRKDLVTSLSDAPISSNESQEDTEVKEIVEYITVVEEVVTEQYPDGTVITKTSYKEILGPRELAKDKVNITENKDQMINNNSAEIKTDIKCHINNSSNNNKNDGLSNDSINSFSNDLADTIINSSIAKEDKTPTISISNDSNNTAVCDLHLFAENILSKTLIQSLNDIKSDNIKEQILSREDTTSLLKNDVTRVSKNNINKKNGFINSNKKEKILHRVCKKSIDRHKHNLIYNLVNVLVNNILSKAQNELFTIASSRKTQHRDLLEIYADNLARYLIHDTTMSFKPFKKFHIKGRTKAKNDKKTADISNSIKTQVLNIRPTTVPSNNDTTVPETLNISDNKISEDTGNGNIKSENKKSNTNIDEKSIRNNNSTIETVVNGNLPRNNENYNSRKEDSPDNNIVKDNVENRSEEITIADDNGEKVPIVLSNDVIDKEINISITGGVAAEGKDQNHNFVKKRTGLLAVQNRPISDRPLSGFAEKLAELLAEEDDIDIDLFDSQEDLNESLTKMKNNFEKKPSITGEIEQIQRRYSVEELNDFGSKKLKSKISTKKKRRTRGERPKSLYAQDLLNDLLNDNATFEDVESEEDVSEDEIKPVKATIDLFENTIPLIPPKEPRLSSSTEYDAAFDEVLKSRRSESIVTSRPGEAPYLRRAAVIDAGCGVLKAGFCGEITPKCYCPSVIGVPRRFSQDVSKMKKGYYVGDEAWSYAGMLQIEHPIRQNISNWSDVTNILEDLLENELHVNDSEHPVMLTEMGQTSRKQREKLTEIIFEKFGIPAFYLANQGCLAMYSQGLTSGLCLNSGFYTTQAIPIYEGHSIPHATTQLNIGGDQVTNYLGRILQGNSGFTFQSSSEKLVLNSMKQAVCYVATDAKEEQEKCKKSADMLASFTLPDGQIIEVGSERFIAPEILFDPQMLGLHQPSTSELIPESIAQLDLDITDLIADNVLVTGGNTKLKGYSQRLENELSIICKEIDYNIKPKYTDDRILSTWIGGSVLSSISGYRDQWVTIDQYAEMGSKIVHILCF